MPTGIGGLVPPYAPSQRGAGVAHVRGLCASSQWSLMQSSSNLHDSPSAFWGLQIDLPVIKSSSQNAPSTQLSLLHSCPSAALGLHMPSMLGSLLAPSQ